MYVIQRTDQGGGYIVKTPVSSPRKRKRRASVVPRMKELSRRFYDK